MPLNLSKGNMYEFITHTWNTIKGKCYHDCSYCYMKRWKNQKPVRFDEKELKTDLRKDNFIFVGSSCDLFADDIPISWILKTLEHCHKFDNKYLFQTKNPVRFLELKLPSKSVICLTIESSHFYPKIMNNCPTPLERSNIAWELAKNYDIYLTIEPIIDFNIESFTNTIFRCKPKQVNIGADTGNNNLPEPSKEKILQLIENIKPYTTVHLKKNLNRLIK